MKNIILKILLAAGVLASLGVFVYLYDSGGGSTEISADSISASDQGTMAISDDVSSSLANDDVNDNGEDLADIQETTKKSSSISPKKTDPAVPQNDVVRVADLPKAPSTPSSSTMSVPVKVASSVVPGGMPPVKNPISVPVTAIVPNVIPSTAITPLEPIISDAEDAVSSSIVIPDATTMTTTTTDTSASSTEEVVASSSIPSTSTDPTPSAPNHLFIAQVQIEGASSSNDFVKIFNPTVGAVDVSGWKLHKKSSTGTDYSLRTFEAGSTIVAGGYFIWANSGGGFADSIGADVSSTETLSANNSAILFDANGDIIDQVTWGTGTDFTFSATPQ
jgi:hypothetical protein